jgi:hypothetical protein
MKSADLTQSDRPAILELECIEAPKSSQKYEGIQVFNGGASGSQQLREMRIENLEGSQTIDNILGHRRSVVQEQSPDRN